MTDFERSTKREHPRTPTDVNAVPAPVVDQPTGPHPIRRSIGSMPSGLSVGPADDPIERDADAVASRVVRSLRRNATDDARGPGAQRAQRSAPPGSGGPNEATGQPAAPSRIQRSALTISRTAPTVIRRKIGNQGTPLVGRKVRKVSDTAPGNQGTIKSWSAGGAMWSLTAAVGLSNVVYDVEFSTGIQKISAGDDTYELVPVDASPAPTTSKQSSTSSKTPTPQPSADTSTINAINALIERLGKPLTELPGASSANGKDRRDLVNELRALLKPPDSGAASKLGELTERTKKVEDAFRLDAAARVVEREQREAAKEAEERRAAASRVEQKRLETVRGENKARSGGSYKQLDGHVPDADQLAALLATIPKGEEGHLTIFLSKKYTVDDLKKLIGAGLTPKTANELLALMTAPSVQQLVDVLGHVKPLDTRKVADLLRVTAPDKTVLVALLTKLGDNAAAALAVMANAAPGSEASVLAMLNGGRSATETASLLDTTSGRTDTAGAATISAGVADVNTARTLLEQPGVSGNAAQALQVLAHRLVNNDIAKATQLLNKQGNAADALALLGHGCTLAVAGQLLATPGIVGHGADAVWCLEQGCTAADLAALLALRGADEIRRIHAAGHAFATVRSELALNPGQLFWAGERCAAPSFSAPETSIANIIAHAVYPPSVGDYSGSNRFWNSGRFDSDGVPVMFLPPGTYREYDLKPFTTSAARGVRRIVADGAVMYYTDDHYRTFKRFA